MTKLLLPNLSNLEYFQSVTLSKTWYTHVYYEGLFQHLTITRNMQSIEIKQPQCNIRTIQAKQKVWIARTMEGLFGMRNGGKNYRWWLSIVHICTIDSLLVSSPIISSASKI